jgi:hypothetical protein
MRTPPGIQLIAITSAMMLSTSASAIGLPPREVRIHQERFVQLPLIEQQRVLEIKDRLEAIIATDRASLNHTERIELRSEWKELKSEMKKYGRNGPVVYISTAALIIIILLLIILL